MKGFMITGKNGTYVELEDGRFADSVEVAGAPVGELLEELTETRDGPEYSTMSLEELREYVGA